MVERGSAYSAQARSCLVANLREQGVLCSHKVARAFLAVRRELFVPWFYEQEGFTWVKRSPDWYEPNAWIDAVYQDRSRVTLVDNRNWPISASSAPVVMAMMLETLALTSGMSVLEIGTGTGYNAALLARLVDDPSLITTIEIEESLAHTAEQLLQHHIGPVRVHVGDGRLGVPERAPFDRIIATASSPGIPRAWYEQLAPGGRLVMDLQGSLNRSGFLMVEKFADGSASGTFDPRHLHFMPLRPGDDLLTRPVSRLLRQPVTGEVSLPDDEQTAMLLQNPVFHWFLQWSTPGLSLARALKGTQPFFTLIDAARETILQLYQHDGLWSGSQRGGTGLWETIEQAYREWDRLGRPGLDAYAVRWDQQAELFRLDLRASETVAFDL